MVRITAMQMLLLGLIKERPLNPYEMINFLTMVNAKQWLDYAESSVYASINALSKKEMIVGKEIKDSNMPPRMIYQITESGSNIFQMAVSQQMGGEVEDNTLFKIAVMFICHLPKQQVSQLLEKYRACLESKAAGINQYAEMLRVDKKLPGIVISNVRSSLHMTNAKLATVREIIGDIENEPRWDFFITKDLIHTNPL